MDILLYGAGDNGIRALYELGKENVKVFLDSYKTGNISGVPVIKPEEYDGDKKEALVFVTVDGHYRAISETLKNNDYPLFMPYRTGNLPPLGGGIIFLGMGQDLQCLYAQKSY